MPAYQPLLWTPPRDSDELWTFVDAGPKLWTSPSRTSTLLPSADAVAVSRAVDKGRRAVDLPATGKRSPPSGDTDGHLVLSLEQRLKFWAPSVTVTLLAQQLTRGMQLDSSDATKSVKLMVPSASGPEPLATLRRPTMNKLHTDTQLGLPKVKSESSKRHADADAVMAEAKLLDLVLMESIGRNYRQHPHLHLLVVLTLEVAAIASHLFKDLFVIPRPAALWGDIQPMIAAPGHASFPSGHATQAFAAIAVLVALLGERAGKTPRRLAQQIADNRVTAGIHYPFDSDAGHALGHAVGIWIAGSVEGGKFEHGEFDAQATNPQVTFTPSAHAAPSNPLLAALWTLAKVEVDQADK